ncbi:MAG TPA: helix-turn-helix transcriptional regulator [Candidatus Dormibacteraeota bacterium]|nr:helix-turn-helix transcriptional regulator [Candidatus Dormibacteraeota bacterium]
MAERDRRELLRFVGERLMSARVRRGFSLETAAEEGDVEDERLEAAEAGTLALDEDELADLAEVYGQAPEWFFGGETTPVQYLLGP